MLQVNLEKKIGNICLKTRFQVEKGEIFGILGPSGSGKTTILNMLAGLIRPDVGEIKLNQRVLFNSENRLVLPPYKRGIGYVFQSSSLFPHFSVKANITYALSRKNDLKVQELLEKLDLIHLADRFPHNLSGGEKQRVALARTLASDPQCLLFDEPFSALDIVNKERLQQYVKKMTEQFYLPTVLVTHDLSEAKNMADNLNYLNNGRLTKLTTGLTLQDDDNYLNRICKYVV